MKYNLFLLLSIGFITIGCNNNANTSHDGEKNVNDTNTKSHENGKYDLAKPARTWDLPPELKEISGNTWIDKDHLLVIEDLHPDLYLVKLGKDATVEKDVAFEASEDKKLDIEDVTMANNVVYALWSHGVIFKITDWQNAHQTKEISTFLHKKNNTEGICFDPVTQNLLVACKNESDVEDAKKSTRAVYAFDLKEEKLGEQPFMVIEAKDFKAATGEKIDIYPSAIAVHPLTHDIYILSTKVTKCMVQYSHDGQFKSIQMINKDQMPQPEGICFAPDGTLYISSEGKHGEPARIFQYNN